MRRLASSLVARALIDGVLPRIDDRLRASTRPFDGRAGLLPHVGEAAWAWTHYGVFVPLLPAPHRYLNTMTLIGSTGTELFDNDAIVAGDARTVSTVFSSTAADGEHHYRAYPSEEYRHDPDGGRLQWGDDLCLEVGLPRVRVRGRYETFEVDLDLTVTDQVSYFTKNPIYQHLSLLAPYTCSVRDAAGETEVSGLATFEYARAWGHQSLMSRPVPTRLKLPADFFTYQVIQLDEVTQLLLTDVSARGATACRLLHVRTLGGSAEVYDDVAFAVTKWGQAQVDPWGRAMRVPAELAWVAKDDEGNAILEIRGTLDAPFRFGHGRGYASAYTYTGSYRGRAVAGSAYIEWVDVRRLTVA